jgi:Glycosyl hydrolase family 12
MKHRAKTKHRFWPVVVAAVLVATAGGGTAVLVAGSGHDPASLASTAPPSAGRGQVVSALEHKHEPKRSPSPSPSSPSPRPASPSPGPSSPPAGPTGSQSWAWCSSDVLATWNTSDGFDLYNNKWNSSGNPGPQRICGNSGHDWQVTSTQRARNTAVLTYPSVQRNYPNRALSSFTSMTSSYAETMNAVAGTDAEAAYDIWINDLNKEVMFWVDNHGQTPAGSKVATVTLGGLTWDYYQDSGYYAFVLNHNATTGTVDLLAGIRYLMSRGALSASDKLWQVNFGFEICSTVSVPQTFTVSNYTLASS